MIESQVMKLSVFSGVAIEALLQEVLPVFTQQTGIAVDATYDVNPNVARRIIAGEHFDVGLTNPWFFDEMVSQGRVMPGIHVPLARIPLTIGSAAPPRGELLRSHDAVRALLLGAESIAYIATGTSGKTFLKAIEMMGLAPALRDRLRPMGQGEPPQAAARGEVQYAVAPLSRIIAAPGVSPIATFPTDLNLHIDMSMFMSESTDRNVAMQLIDFLSDTARCTALRAHGVQRLKTL